MTEATTMLDAALQYVDHGWFIFPLHTPRPDGCSCRKPQCSNVGKHPRTSHGVNDATNDRDRVSTWWGMWPDANIGIACGPSGLVVIDVDPRHGGDESLADLKKKWGKDRFRTVSAHTGGGGEHYIFAQPAGIPISNIASSEKFNSPLGPGIDVRAAGGYIVAPPSLHASGGYYEWYIGESPFEMPPLLLPHPLIDALETKFSPRDDNTPPISAAAILSGIPESHRDISLWQLACKLRYADVPIDWAYQLVEAAALAAIPPFDTDIARDKVKRAYKNFTPGGGAFVTDEEAEAALKHADGLQGRVDLLPHILGLVPAPEWLYEGILLKGHVHMFHGEPGCGKTIVALHIIIDTLRKGLPVMLVDEESGPLMIGSRLRLMGLEEQHVSNLHYFPFAGINLEHAEDFLAYVEEHKPALIVWDSLADVLSASKMDEDAAKDVTRWVDETALPAARDYGAACLILDHETKDQGNTRYSRGSGAKKAKMDIAYHVEKTVDFDQSRLGKVTLLNTKNRVGSAEQKAVFAVGGEGGALIAERYKQGLDDASSLTDREREALAFIRNAGADGASNSELQTALGLGASRVRTITSDLSDKGFIASIGVGKNLRYIPHDSATGGIDTATGGSLGDRLTATRGDPPYVVGGRPLAGSGQGAETRDRPHWWQDKESEEEGW